jgi:hypothetical protein
MVDPVDSKRDKKRDIPSEPKPLAAGADTLVHVRPLVLTKSDLRIKDRYVDDDDYDEEKKKSRRGKSSSRTARRLKDIERRVSKAVRRVARAAEHGTEEYIDARDRSAGKRRDGAIVDIYENVARGVSKGLAEASPVLVDIAEAYNTRESRKQARKFLRNLPRLPIIG